jgi:hypothetical protein
LSVLVAPVSRLALVLGKILGATTIGVLQGLLLLPLAPLVGLPLNLAQLPALLGCMVLVAFGLTGLGFFFAWWLNSVQGFHSVMNVVLMPMWLLSGAVFPPEGAHLRRWVTAALSYARSRPPAFSRPLPDGDAGIRRCHAGGRVLSSHATLAGEFELSGHV